MVINAVNSLYFKLKDICSFGKYGIKRMNQIVLLLWKQIFIFLCLKKKKSEYSPKRNKNSVALNLMTIHKPHFKLYITKTDKNRYKHIFLKRNYNTWIKHLMFSLTNSCSATDGLAMTIWPNESSRLALPKTYDNS